MSEKSAIFGRSSLEESNDPTPLRVDITLGTLVSDISAIVRSTATSRILASSQIDKHSKVLLTESVNLGDQGLPASDSSESIISESHAPAEQNEALLRISQDMAPVLERLTAPKSLIDLGLRNSMGQISKSPIKLNSSRKSCILVRCPPDQRVSCAVSLLQSEAYDLWKLALRSPRLPDPIP